MYLRQKSGRYSYALPGSQNEENNIMGQEITIKFKNEPINKDLIFSFFNNHQKLILLSPKSDEKGYSLLLRFRELPVRESWPEDITVNLLEDELYLCFHSGNINFVKSIIDNLVVFLTEKNYDFDVIEG